MESQNKIRNQLKTIEWQIGKVHNPQCYLGLPHLRIPFTFSLLSHATPPPKSEMRCPPKTPPGPTGYRPKKSKNSKIPKTLPSPDPQDNTQRTQAKPQGDTTPQTPKKKPRETTDHIVKYKFGNLV